MVSIVLPPRDGGTDPDIVLPGSSGGTAVETEFPRAVGPQGEPGPEGPQGPQGGDGPAGVGVPVGGTTGQVLAKISATNYATAWVDQTGGGVSPPFAISDTTGLQDALNSKQPLDSDLTSIAALTTTTFGRNQLTYVDAAAAKTALTLVKADVGLSNVDNTSDAAKPVSTAQQTALNLKANLASPTFTGMVGGITAAMVGLGNVTNTSDANKPVSTAQQTALDLKANLASPTFTGTVSGISKAMVGLGNVDNTADTAKPVSTAQLTALNLKANLASPTFTGTVTLPAGQVVNGVTLTTGGAATAYLNAAGAYTTPAGGGGGSSDPLLLATEYITPPAAPATGTTVYTSDKGGRRRVAFIGPSGLSTAVQALVGSNKVRWWTAQGNATTVTAINMIAIANGTATARTVASTNLFTSISRLAYISTAAINSAAGVRHNAVQFMVGSGGTAPGGIDYIVRFGLSAVTNATRGFIGICGTGSSLGNTDPTAYTNIVGVGFDTADLTFQFLHNDGSGTATKTNCGAAFPCNTANVDFYEVRVFIPPLTSQATISIERLNTGDYAELTTTTNIPAAGALLAEQLYINSVSDAAAVAIDVSSRYIETDY